MPKIAQYPIRCSFYIDEKTLKETETFAYKNGNSRGKLIREAIKEYLENHNEGVRMMTISFGWTIKAFQDGVKTVTRRFWTDNYASKFHKGDIINAYDFSPRNGGRKIGQIRLTKNPYKQKLKDMPDEHFEREGGIYYWSDKKDYIEFMGGEDKELYVVEFEKI